MQRQQGNIDSHAMPWLHIDVYSAQTGIKGEKNVNVGVSRYLEIDGIRYDKTENLTDFSRYDYLLTHDPMEAGEEFRVIGVEKCFSGIDWTRKWIKLDDCVFLMQKV